MTSTHLETEYGLRGGALRLWNSEEHEVILSGPAETGKTWGCCAKLHYLMQRHPGAQGAMLRKTLNSLYPTVFQTYKRIVGAESGVRFYGGEKPEWADYPNGSRIYFAGMDNPQKALSSERDYIYINQVEELLVQDWETLTTRCTGRAGNAPYAQIYGDCNPGPPTHWIKQREGLPLLESRHEDNPALFDADGQQTAQGVKTLAILDRLTGIRYSRLRLGAWVAAEGVVYDAWDRAVHLIDRFEIPSDWRRIRSIDFGYTNPFVCQWWAIDGDGRMYLYREIYRAQRIVSAHAVEILRLSEGEHIEATVADHDAEDRATLANCGIRTVPAWKSISPGIQAVQNRLQVAGDGKPRLYILRDSLTERDDEIAANSLPVCTEQEFEGYVWPKGADGRPVKETPVDVNNHGMDGMRYGVAYADNLGKRVIKSH